MRLASSRGDYHGGSSLNNVANLYVIMAIRNTEFFEVLLPDAMQKYGLAEDTAVDRNGFVRAPNEPASALISIST